MKSLWWQAVAQRLARSFLRFRMARGRRGSSVRTIAFADYRAALLREFGQSERSFVLRSRSVLAERGEGLRTYEIVLEGEERLPWQPGDLLYLRWRNSAARVSAVKARLPARTRPMRVLTYGHALRPPRLERVTPEAFLGTIVDLHAAHPEHPTWGALKRRQPRIRPRIFTVSKIRESEGRPILELIVSTVAGGRASGYLQRLPVGERLFGYRLPHPHRLPGAYGFRGPGVCIVTGSAVAGVLVHLRSQASLAPIWLIWGVKDEDRAFYREELCRYLDSGRLARLDIVASRSVGDAPGEYVQDFVRRQGRAIESSLEPDGWLYVSGQKSMAQAVSLALRELYGEATVDQWRDRMRLVISASG